MEKVEEGRREAASPRLSGLSGQDAGTEGRIPTSNPYRMKCHSFLPLPPVMRAPAPTREKEGDRTSSLTSSPPSSASGSSVQPGTWSHPHPSSGPVPPVLPIRPLNLLEPQALLHSHNISLSHLRQSPYCQFFSTLNFKMLQNMTFL